MTHEEIIANKANLQGANLRGANLRGANLQGANLQGANLREANLQGADLQGADLWGADLWEADLQGADLQGANLQGADLRGAKVERNTLHSLFGLQHLPSPIYSFKLVSPSLASPMQRGEKITYEIGAEIKVEQWEEDERISCGAGINLATWDWCCRNKEEHHRILLVSHTWEDVVCIPLATDGKYRVKRCRVIKEVVL